MPELMRILLVNEARAGGGGVETYLSAIAQALTARGHELALLYGNTAAEIGPTTVHTAESWSVADEQDGLSGVLRHVHEWRPDVAYSHNMRRLDVDEMLSREWPVIKMMHGYFGTCVSGQKTFLLPAASVCTRRCGPACLALYGPRRCGRLRPVEVIRNYGWAERQRRLFGRYRAIVVASSHMRQEYIGHGVSAERVHAVPLFALPGQPCSSGTPDIDVLFLGRMTPLKGTDVLPRALERASSTVGRPISTVIAGEGPARAALQTRLAHAPGVRPSFPGWVDERGRADLLARARVVVIPSVWPEPFGLVGLEAACFGVPAIAFDVGGIGEWLTDGVNGCLVPTAGGPDAFGSAIAAVVGDPVEHARLAAGAREAALRFSAAAHVSRLEALFEQAHRS
jgi:glycosyltransferase involved in cell wall biosynthesis